MSELTLAWSENGHQHQHTFHDNQPSKHPGVYRLGRDPARCDLVLHDRSVSALHIEIVFNSLQKQARVKNLRSSNPPLVNGLQLKTGEAALHQGSKINLGRVELTVSGLNFGPTPVASSPLASPDYGLSCPNPACGKVSAYNSAILQQGCPWCGFSLAAANSVVMIPPKS